MRVLLIDQVKNTVEIDLNDYEFRIIKEKIDFKKIKRNKNKTEFIKSIYEYLESYPKKESVNK